MSLRFTLIRLFIAIHALLCSAEWVEITQRQQTRTKTTTATSRPITVLKQTSPNAFGNTETSTEKTTPSPEWLAYQKERFKNSLGFNAQQLIISAQQNLKNSAQIIVPAQLKPNNQIFHVKTRLEVKPAIAPEVSISQLDHSNLETTSRKHSAENYDTSQEEQETNYYDETEDSVSDEDVVENVDDDAANKPTNNLQFPLMQGFMKFLKSLKRTWLKNSTFNIEQKIDLLKRLRDKFMHAIEQQFTALWQPVERKRRNKRGLLEESNLNFPPEAAILSINFLTFAVFLIKLVLQVVHIWRSKHYTISNINNQDLNGVNFQ